MGGMAAQIPIKNDPEASEKAIGQVRADKIREAGDGHDGTWVAHPGLVALAREAFESAASGDNQLDKLREDVQVSAADLLEVPGGTRTEEGLRLNIRVGIQYLEAWLGGVGCVPLNHLMEDAATAEISRAQLWQWIRHERGVLEDGRKVTAELVREELGDELDRAREELGDEAFSASRFELAASLFEGIVTAGEFTDFLTLPAYAHI